MHLRVERTGSYESNEKEKRRSNLDEYGQENSHNQIQLENISE